MMRPPMKIAVIGAGAMGSLFAARLIDAGAEVTLVDVDQRLLDTLRTQGLCLQDEHGGACSGRKRHGPKTCKAWSMPY